MSEPLPEEKILIIVPNLYRWVGTETNATFLSALQGVVVVTTHRFCFLKEIGLTHDDIGDTDNITTVIDRYLKEPTCFDLPFDQIASIEVLQRWDDGNYLRVMGMKEDHTGFAYAFMFQYGLDPSELNEIKDQVSQRITPSDMDPDLIEGLASDSGFGKHGIGILVFSLAILFYAMYPNSRDIKESWAKQEITTEIYTKSAYFNADVKLLDAIDQGDLTTANELLEKLQVITDDNCYVNCSPIYTRSNFEKVDQ